MKTATKVTHTPGPWQIIESDDKGWESFFAIVPTDDELPLPDLAIADCTVSGGAMRLSGDGFKTIPEDSWGPEALAENRELALANARLIAAAPELLEALRLAEKIVQSQGPIYTLEAEAMRAAIAKAEGR